MSGGSREEGFAALLTIITEANKQRNWLGFVTPNFTIGTAIYARLFRVVVQTVSSFLHLPLEEGRGEGYRRQTTHPSLTPPRRDHGGSNQPDQNFF
jgi:hypothetical protein